MIRIAILPLIASPFDSATDEVVTPEIGPFYTSRLDGASIVRIQGNVDFSCKYAELPSDIFDAVRFGHLWTAQGQRSLPHGLSFVSIFPKT